MSIISRLLLAAVATAGIANCAVAALTAPRIRTATFSGNGCPSENQTQLTTEGDKLIVNFSNFSVQIGPGISPTAKTMNCGGHFNIEEGIPGYQLVIKTIHNEGYIYSTGGVTLTTFTTVFWSQDASKTYDARSSQAVEGEGATLERYNETTTVPAEYGSSCEASGGNVGILNINWRVSFTASSSDAYGVFLGMEDSPVTEVIEFDWVPCDAPATDTET